MRFNEYIRYINNQYHPLNGFLRKVENDSVSYFKFLIEKLIISIGMKNDLRLVEQGNSLLIFSENTKKMEFVIRSNLIKGKDEAELVLEINSDVKSRVSISPEYYKREHIHNYLRTCEIEMKKAISLLKE